MPEIMHTSCGLLISVEAVEPVGSFDLADLGRLGEWPCGSSVAQGAVRTVIVVVALELAYRGCGVSFVDDQDPVEEFAADGADEAFGDGVAACPSRRTSSLKPLVTGCAQVLESDRATFLAAQRHGVGGIRRAVY